MRIAAAIGPDEVVGLGDRVRRALAASGRECLVCEVGPGGTPDAATVDGLARIALAARRLGRPMALRRIPVELVELIAFTGLAGVAELGLEAQGDAEHREEAVDVEEERDRADPVTIELDDLE